MTNYKLKEGDRVRCIRIYDCNRSILNKIGVVIDTNDISCCVDFGFTQWWIPSRLNMEKAYLELIEKRPPPKPKVYGIARFMEKLNEDSR